MIINLPLGFIERSSAPVWIAVCANFCFITFFTLCLWGIFFQELDYGQTWWKLPIVKHLVRGLLIQPFASIAEGLSAIWAMSSEDFGKREASRVLLVRAARSMGDKERRCRRAAKLRETPSGKQTR